MAILLKVFAKYHNESCKAPGIRFSLYQLSYARTEGFTGFPGGIAMEIRARYYSKFYGKCNPILYFRGEKWNTPSAGLVLAERMNRYFEVLHWYLLRQHGARQKRG